MITDSPTKASMPLERVKLELLHDKLTGLRAISLNDTRLTDRKDTGNWAVDESWNVSSDKILSALLCCSCHQSKEDAAKFNSKTWKLTKDVRCPQGHKLSILEKTLDYIIEFDPAKQTIPVICETCGWTGQLSSIAFEVVTTPELTIIEKKLLIFLRRYVANDHVHGGVDELTQEAEDFIEELEHGS